MAFSGYLMFGGTELLNQARTYTYVEQTDCPPGWLRCTPCPGLGEALGVPNYQGTLQDAPWYDAEDEATHRFYGMYPVEIEGLEGSTRTATITEGILDGGVVQGTRREVRQLRVRGVMIGQGHDALDAGLSWLDAALEGDTCSTHGSSSCGEVDGCFFITCPPARPMVTEYTPWTIQATNLATNPSMETAAGTVAVATNLATNPSFEQATAATVEVRRNLAQVPIPTATWTSNNSSLYAATVDATGGVRNGPVLRVTRSASSPSVLISSLYNVGTTAWTVGGRVAVTPGQVITVSVYVKSSTASTNGTVSAYFFDAANAAVGSALTGPAVPLSTTAFTRVSHTVTVPAGATNMGFGSGTALTSGNTVGGEIAYFTDAMIEVAPAAGTYVDGTLAAAGDFTYAWTGTVNASASVQYGLAVPELTGSGAAVVQSKEWASSGVTSARIISKSPGTGTAFTIARNFTAADAGKTFTFVAKVRVTSAFVTGGVLPRSMFITQNVGGNIQGPQAPNVAGVHELRWTYTLNAGLTSGTFRLYHGGTMADPDMWVDDLLIVEGTYTGPYFDGSTPAKVRRNLAADPQSYSGGVVPVNTIGIKARWFGSGGAGTVATVVGVGPVPAITRYHRVQWSTPPSGGNAEVGFNLTNTASSNAGAASTVDYPVTPGQTTTYSVYVRLTTTVASLALRMRLLYRQASGAIVAGTWNPTSPAVTLNDTTRDWVRFSFTHTAPATAAFVGIAVYADGGAIVPAVGDTLDATGVLVEYSPDLGSYFDGATAPTPTERYGWEGAANASPSYVTDPDLTPAWTGTANASTSELRGAGVAATVSPISVVRAIQSTRWVGSRSKSLRQIPAYSTRGSAYTDLATHATPRGLERGKTYTALVTFYQEKPQGFVAPRARSVTLMGTSTGQDVQVQAADAAGAQNLRLTFAVPATGDWYLRLYNGGMSGDPDVWWDDVAIVEGAYPGEYFDGTGADSEFVQYSWSSTPDASTSYYETRATQQVPVDDAAYDELIDPLRRRLHGLTAISGPLVLQHFHSGDWHAYEVEYTLAATTPYVFGVQQDLAVSYLAPTIVQDSPFNLVPYPSAELADAATLVVATNYNTNPSIEVDASGWTAGTNGFTPAPTGARSTEIAASGGASYKVTVTATNSGVSPGGSIYGIKDVALPAAVPGRAFSITTWLAAFVGSGTAVIGGTRLRVEWRDATTTLRSDAIGSGSANGQAISARALVPPAGAITARIVAVADVTSWSVGAVINLFIDASAVTVP